MKKTTKIFGLLLTLFGLALVTGCNLPTNALNENVYLITIPEFENGTVSVDKKYALADETVTLTVFPAEGYKLENITVNDGKVSLSGEGNTRVFKMPESDVVVDASFIEDKPEPNPEETTYYTVNFNSNGGSPVESKSVKSGEKVEKPANPTKDSTESETYTFDNWYTSTDEGTTLSDTAFEFDTEITSDITLYAKWAVNAVTHTVTFDTNGGSPVPEVQTIVYGNKATKPADPTKDETNTERYSFAYWYTSDKPDSAFDFNTEIKEDITLYAKWNTTALYSITIASGIANGTVSANKTDKIAAGETITLTVTPKTGYELVTGTLSVKNGNSEIAVTQDSSDTIKYTFTMPAGNVTVSATFKEIINEYVIRLFLKVGNSSLIEFGETEQNEKIAIKEKIELNQNGKFLWSALKTESELNDYFFGKVKYCFNRTGESDYTVSVTPPEGITEYLYSLLENEGVILDRENLEIHLNYNCIY